MEPLMLWLNCCTQSSFLQQKGWDYETTTELFEAAQYRKLFPP